MCTVIRAQVALCHLGRQILYLTFLSKEREDNNDVVASCFSMRFERQAAEHFTKIGDYLAYIAMTIKTGIKLSPNFRFQSV